MDLLKLVIGISPLAATPLAYAATTDTFPMPPFLLTPTRTIIDHSKKKKNSHAVMVICASLGSVMLLVLVAELLVRHRNRTRRRCPKIYPSPLPEPGNNLIHELSPRYLPHGVELPLSRSNSRHELPVNARTSGAC